MQMKIILKKINGAETETEKIHSFVFRKDIFQPCTEFNAVFYTSADTDGVCEIRFYSEGKLLHSGIADTVIRKTEQGGTRVKVSSRGYTSLLAENQLEPDLYTDISIDDLFENYICLPNITHESSTVKSYIYVKKGSSMWDSAVNLAYKITQRHPYIRGADRFMINMPHDSVHRSYSLNDAVSCGRKTDTRRMASHFSMADINDEYGTFLVTENKALERGIIRRRYFELDRRFLYSPIKACEFRAMMSEREYEREFFTYKGFNGDDLNDTVSFENIHQKRVSGLKVYGNRNGIFTEISVDL